ncbi:MAG: hypothetical protein RLZ72_767 [Actinomycetota bacterium]|jgi:hypothetical protein
MFEISVLKERIREMEGPRVDPRLPVHSALSGLIGGGLVPGGVYSLSPSLTLALGLATEAVAESGWVCAVGFPHLGIEAVAECGIALDRFVSIPSPKEHWATVVGAVCDGFTVVIARSPGTVSAPTASRIAAVARRTGAVLIVLGEWPGATAKLEVVGVRNLGLEDGHGLLTGRDIRVRAVTRGVTKAAVLPWPFDRDVEPDIAPVRHLRAVE